MARAVAVDRLDLGFVDMLSYEGALDHPLSGPREQLYWRRALVPSTEPPRSRQPVVEPGVVASIGAVFDIRPRRAAADPEAVEQVLERDRAGPQRAALGLPGLRLQHLPGFAEAAALGRATLRQCPPYQERRAEEAQRAAAMDMLTGLATFRVLRDRLSHEVERSKRSGDGFAVLFIDLDRFKEMNDRFGHEAGQRGAAGGGGGNPGAVRASDLAARYGGDEFVVILTRTDLDGAERVAEALRAGIEGVGRRLGYPTGMVTVSIGIAEYDPDRPSRATCW